MKANADWITLTPLEVEVKTKKGMILDPKLIRFKEGVVFLSPIDKIKTGVHVIYDKANAHVTRIDNIEYLIIKARDIAVIL